MTDSDDRTLEELAREAREERERTGSSRLDVDESGETGDTREDHGGDAGPLQGEAEEVPMGSFKQAQRQDGPRL